MKYLILALAMTLSTQALAQGSCETKVESVDEVREDVNTPTPKELEGATIIVKLKDRTTREMKAETFKVVPRKQQLKVKKETITKNVHCAPVVVRSIVKEEVPVRQKNIISLSVTRMVSDYDIDQQGNSIHIENRFKPVLGLMYQRNVYKSLYLGVAADLNRSLGANIGLGF